MEIYTSCGNSTNGCGLSQPGLQSGLALEADPGYSSRVNGALESKGRSVLIIRAHAPLPPFSGFSNYTLLASAHDTKIQFFSCVLLPLSRLPQIFRLRLHQKLSLSTKMPLNFQGGGGGGGGAGGQAC